MNLESQPADHSSKNILKLFVYNIYDFHLVLSFSESMLMPVIIQDLVIDIETGLANIYIYIYIDTSRGSYTFWDKRRL